MTTLLLRNGSAPHRQTAGESDAERAVSSTKSDDPSQWRDTKLISREEVAKHNRYEDCWVILDGEVLALPKSFLEEHPGGSDTIFQRAGLDITQEFNEYGHSASATWWARRYCIGQVGVRPGLVRARSKSTMFLGKSTMLAALSAADEEDEDQESFEDEEPSLEHHVVSSLYRSILAICCRHEDSADLDTSHIFEDISVESKSLALTVIVAAVAGLLAHRLISIVFTK